MSSALLMIACGGAATSPPAQPTPPQGTREHDAGAPAAAGAMAPLPEVPPGGPPDPDLPPSAVGTNIGWMREAEDAMRAAAPSIRAACATGDATCLCRMLCELALPPLDPGARATIRYPYAEVDGLAIDVVDDGSVARCAHTGGGEAPVRVDCAQP